MSYHCTYAHYIVDVISDLSKSGYEYMDMVFMLATSLHDIFFVQTVLFCYRAVIAKMVTICAAYAAQCDLVSASVMVTVNHPILNGSVLQ